MTDDICGIYLITNKINGHMYVGQSIDIHRRWREHCALKGLDSSLVEKAIAKYGEENFSFDIIITLENDTEKLNDAEHEWIAILNTYEDKNHYNQTPGGDFSPMNISDIKEKHAQIMKSNEVRKKISETKKGQKLSEETKKKMSEARSGENNPMFGKKGEESPNFGRKHTPEAKAKMSKALSGENHPMFHKKFSEEHRKKLSEAHKCKKHSEETRKKMSEVRNTTGYFRVIRRKCPDCKNGLRYTYRYRDNNNKKHEISSVDLEKLEQKVKAKGLEWLKLDDDDDNILLNQ